LGEPEKRAHAEVVFVVTNAAGGIVRASKLVDDTEKEATDGLLYANETLSNFHAMMRMELTGGW